MHKLLADKMVASIRTRVAQGDNPTEPAVSVENLEDLVLTLAALSQNPGTSNTSGEAGPVAWRFKADDPHYDDAYVYCATEEMALLRCPKNSKVEPLYAALEPRASDREAVIDEIEAIIDAKVAEIDGQIPNSPRMRGRIGYAIERLSELRDAIRKLSEVSHEH